MLNEPDPSAALLGRGFERVTSLGHREFVKPRDTGRALALNFVLSCRDLKRLT